MRYSDCRVGCAHRLYWWAQPTLRTRIIPLLVIVVVTAFAPQVTAQTSSIFDRDLPVNGQSPIMLDGGSWTYIPPTLPRRLQIHDRISVRVEELASMTQEGEVERRKTASYNAVLQDWISLIGLKAIKPNAQTDGDQTIAGQLQQLYRAEGDVKARESLTLNIACTVADIRPNGDLVLEGHKQIRVNDDFWEVSLSGICRKEDVGADNVVSSRNIVNMKLDKRERGHVRDGYKRGWLVRWLDEFHPF